MKYYISEGNIEDNYNALSKARQDTIEICNKCLFSSIKVNTLWADKSNKNKKIYRAKIYLKNYFIFRKLLNKLNSGDEVIIQYPLEYSVLLFDKIIKDINKKGVKTTVIIHDIDSLRFPNIPRLKIEDKTVLKSFNKVISHNFKMSDYLMSLGVQKKNIVELELFDYLNNSNHEKSLKNCKNNIIIAGNLTPEKARYITKLHKLINLRFLLYGLGYEKNEIDKNIEYMGAFKPNEIVNKLQGGFGLVWDGTDIDTCNGIYGNYLKYNNPHKLSLYLASNIPVIVWKQSATAEFVLSNNIGIVVDSLFEIEDKINKLSDKDYEIMLNNTKKISQKIKNGEYLKKALNKEI